MKRLPGYIDSSEPDYPVHAINSINDKRIKGHDIRVRRHPHDAVDLVPNEENILLRDVVFEHHLSSFTLPWFVCHQVDLKSEPVDFRQIAAANRRYTPGEVGTCRVEWDVRGVVNWVRGVGRERTIFGKLNLDDVEGENINKPLDSVKNKLVIILSLGL